MEDRLQNLQREAYQGDQLAAKKLQRERCRLGDHVFTRSGGTGPPNNYPLTSIDSYCEWSACESYPTFDAEFRIGCGRRRADLYNFRNMTRKPVDIGIPGSPLMLEGGGELLVREGFERFDMKILCHFNSSGPETGPC